MKKELENKLYNIDPTFFEDAIACENKEKNEMDTCMYWGCECGDGWFKPLEKFMHKVKFINELAKRYNTKFVCEQLKEKYGELRVYYKIFKRKISDWEWQESLGKFIKGYDLITAHFNDAALIAFGAKQRYGLISTPSNR